jgi:hypothetical protein
MPGSATLGRYCALYCARSRTFTYSTDKKSFSIQESFFLSVLLDFQTFIINLPHPPTHYFQPKTPDQFLYLLSNRIRFSLKNADRKKDPFTLSMEKIFISVCYVLKITGAPSNVGTVSIFRYFVKKI